MTSTSGEDSKADAIKGSDVSENSPALSKAEPEKEQKEQEKEENKLEGIKESEPDGNAETKEPKDELPNGDATVDPEDSKDEQEPNVAESEAETEKLDPSELQREHDLEPEEETGKKRKHEEEDRHIKKRKVEETEGKQENDTRNDDEEEEEEAEDAENRVKESQRKEAIAFLSEIEVEFAKLRDSFQEDKMAKYVAEIEMCAEGTHPELSKVAVQIGNIRDEKMRLARSQLDYQLKCIDNQTRASRFQLHQQCFKDQAEARHELLAQTTGEWYRVNRERRARDFLVPGYTFKVPESRGGQIRQRQYINDQISELAGVAKYVGFPCAPGVPDGNPEEAEEDLMAMGLF